MTRARFEKVYQYFHANDSTKNPERGSPGHDKLHKVRPFYDIVLEKCKTVVDLSECQSVDEAIKVNN